MTIKILGGIGKGLSLFVPAGNTIRPTSVLLRRRIFDAHQNLTDWNFIDLCAGSGAMGFEAWSRGARSLFLIELKKNIFKTLQKNMHLWEQKFAEELHVRPIELHCSCASAWTDLFRKTYCQWSDAQQKQTILFFDPPYDQFELFAKLKLNDWFCGSCWIESDNKKGKGTDFWGRHIDKVYLQGNSYLIISN